MTPTEYLEWSELRLLALLRQHPEIAPELQQMADRLWFAGLNCDSAYWTWVSKQEEQSRDQTHL